MVPQPFPFRAFPDYHETKISMPEVKQRLLQVRQSAHVFLRRQPSHIADTEPAFLPIAQFRTKNRRVYGVRHQVARLARSRLQHSDHLSIGRKQKPRNSVEACRSAKTPALRMVG